MKLRAIKDKKKIAAVFENGRIINGENISVRALRLQDEEPGYIISVPKKNFPLAVNRNLIRRRIREQVKSTELSKKLSNKFSFFIIYVSKKILESAEIKKELEFLAQKNC
ncbi:ribonuclease P protein component [Flavobacteriales bacterium]|nr:ribonuclease P protein component [Flavobacteriales bacterium]